MGRYATTFGSLRRPRLLGGLAALLALLVQCLLVQTHIDGPLTHQTYVAGASAGQFVAAKADPAPDKPSGCVLCRELATGGGVFLDSSPAHAAWDAIWIALRTYAPQAAAVCLYPAHSWQSRAPPSVP